MVEKDEERMEKDWDRKDYRKWKRYHRGGPGCGGAIYGLGIIGGWVYFIGQSTDFWSGVGGFFQGIFWPAYMVYEIFKFLIK